MRILATMALLAAAGTTWADDAKPVDAKAAEVIKAAIKATGGEAALNKYKAGSINMKGEMSVSGLDLEFDGKVTYMMPDKFKINIKTSLMGQNINIDQVMNGKKMKATLNGMEIPLDDHTSDQLKNSLTEQEVTQLTPLLDAKKFTIKIGDEAEVDGKKADVVVVACNAEGSKIKDMKLFFDKTSHLLVKSQRKDTDENGKEIDEESFYMDYKKVQDIMTSHKGLVKHDGKEYMKFTISDVKYVEKYEDKEFSVDD